MSAKFETENGVVVITLDGNLLGAPESSDLLEKVADSINDGKTKFAIELQAVKFINSSGLSFLLTVLTKARKAGGDIVLVGITEQLSKLLIITKLNSIFSTATTREQAMNILGKS